MFGLIGDAVVQIDQAGYLALERLHAFREGVAQPRHDLEQREIDIADAAAGDPGAAAALQQPLEIAKIFRHALLPEFIGALFGRPALVLVIQRRPERMMGVMDFDDKIRDRQLQLMQPQPSRFGFRREAMARPEIEQDVGGLPDHEFARFEERRRERRRAARLHHLRHRAHAALARHIGVIGAGLLQREADIFAASLDLRPVIKLITHRRFLVVSQPLTRD